MKWIKRIFKALIALLLLLIVGILIWWIKEIYPYESCTKEQIEVHKKRLIDGILEREIRLRELYSQAYGKTFVPSKDFKAQIEKERKKFYKYCETKKAMEPKKARCNIVHFNEYYELGRLSDVQIRYWFDDESLKFFNTIQTYGLTRIEDNVTKKLSDKWYGYKRKILGYYLFDGYWQCDMSVGQHWNDGDLIITEEVDNALVDRDKLILIDSFVIDHTAATKGAGTNIEFGIETYIKKEQ